MRTALPAVANKPKHPRYVREIMKGEVMILITGDQALDRLTLDCKFPEEKARRLLNIAWEFGQKAEPCPGGYVHIWYHGIDDTKQHVFSVVEHIGEGLPSGTRKVYTQGNAMPSRDSGKAKTLQRSRKGREMPPRKNTKTAPEPETTAANGEGDLATAVEKALNKDHFSPTQEDYLNWFAENVVDPSDLAEDLDRLMVMTLQFYGPFQRSDFNREQREARASARAKAAPEDEPEEPAKPAKARGRTTAKAGAAKPAPATTAKAGPTRRARGTRAAATSGSTPY